MNNLEHQELLRHNYITLRELENHYKEGHNCCVVNPCGSGKTSIMMEFIKNHYNRSFIIFTKQKNAKDYYKKNPICMDIPIVTYNKMYIDVLEGNITPYKKDFYILDEAHYMGADKWGVMLQKLIKFYNPRLIGFTATPQRSEDQFTDENIIKQYFQGHSAGNFSLGYLQKENVFVEPEYVLSIYNLQTQVEETLSNIWESDLNDSLKSKYSKDLNLALETWKEKDNPERVFKEVLPNYLYKEYSNKILLYVQNLQELESKKRYIERLVRSVTKKTVRSYVYVYKTSKSVLNEFI